MIALWLVLTSTSVQRMQIFVTKTPNVSINWAVTVAAVTMDSTAMGTIVMHKWRRRPKQLKNQLRLQLRSLTQHQISLDWRPSTGCVINVRSTPIAFRAFVCAKMDGMATESSAFTTVRMIPFGTSTDVKKSAPIQRKKKVNTFHSNLSFSHFIYSEKRNR